WWAGLLFCSGKTASEPAPSGGSRRASGHARWSVRRLGAPLPTAAAASGARRSRGETSCFLAGPPPRTPGIRRHVSRRARTHVLVRDELDTLNHEPLAVRVRCLPALERQRSATRDPALRGDLDGVKAGRERELRVATMLWHERRQPRPRPIAGYATASQKPQSLCDSFIRGHGYVEWV